MQKNKKQNLRKTSLAAIFVCFLAVSAQISLPTPFGVPLSLQVFAVALCGYTLGLAGGTAAVVCYILAGAVGLPVFTAFSGGAHIILGANGGFILGFLCIAVACGLVFKKRLWIKILSGLLALVLCHLWGVLQLKIITDVGLFSAFLGGSAPFILKDIICIILAAWLSARINKLLEKTK